MILEVFSNLNVFMISEEENVLRKLNLGSIFPMENMQVQNLKWNRSAAWLNFSFTLTSLTILRNGALELVFKNLIHSTGNMSKLS